MGRAAALDHVGFELHRLIDGARLLRARLRHEGDLDDLCCELWTWLREVDGLDAADRGQLRQLGLSLSHVRAAVRGELETPEAGRTVADELAGFVTALAEPDGDVYR